MIDTELKIWAAGAFDGEGSALISKIGWHNYKIVVAVGNTDKRFVDIFKTEWAWKSSAAPWTRTKTRYVVVPKEYYRNRGSNMKRDAHQLVFGYLDARQLLLDIKPYLVVKQEEVEVILHAISAVEARSPKDLVCEVLESFYEEYRALLASREGREYRSLRGNTSAQSSVFDVLRERLKSSQAP